MKKLLITGTSGFLGWHLCQLTQQTWQVYGTYHQHSVEVPGVTLLPFDLTDFQALKQLFQQLQPDAVIHTAAASSPNFCQTHPEITQAINVSASCNLAGLSADAGIPCVFTSSDMVFDGQNPPYRESDPVCPVNQYGEQKVAAERGMLERYPQTAICRMPLMFGAAPFAQSFIQPFIEKLRAGEELKLFTDEFRTPVSGAAAAKGLLLALERVHGYIHLGGKERLSRYEFGCLMVKVLDLSMDKLSACGQADVKMAAPRPPDLSMDSSLAFSLGFNPASVEAELRALKEGL